MLVPSRISGLFISQLPLQWQIYFNSSLCYLPSATLKGTGDSDGQMFQFMWYLIHTVHTPVLSCLCKGFGFTAPLYFTISWSDVEMVLFLVGARKHIYTELNNNRLTWTEQRIYKHPTHTNCANISIGNMNGLVPLLSCQLISHKAWQWILHTLTRNLSDIFCTFQFQFWNQDERCHVVPAHNPLGTVKQLLALTCHITSPACWLKMFCIHLH